MDRRPQDPDAIAAFVADNPDLAWAFTPLPSMGKILLESLAFFGAVAVASSLILVGMVAYDGGNRTDYFAVLTNGLAIGTGIGILRTFTGLSSRLVQQFLRRIQVGRLEETDHPDGYRVVDWNDDWGSLARHHPATRKLALLTCRTDSLFQRYMFFIGFFPVMLPAFFIFGSYRISGDGSVIDALLLFTAVVAVLYLWGVILDAAGAGKTTMIVAVIAIPLQVMCLGWMVVMGIATTVNIFSALRHYQRGLKRLGDLEESGI